MSRTHVILLLLATLLLFCLDGTAATYRWIDDEGNVVYSQTPPPDARDTKLIPPPPPPAENPATVMERLRSQTEKLERASQERNRLRAEKEKRKQAEKARERNCETARRNLETLQSRPPNTLYRTGEGQYRRFTIDELNQKIAEQQQIIRENCK